MPSDTAIYSGPLFDAFEATPTEAWWDRIRRELKGRDPAVLTWHPEPGIDVRPFYRQDDLHELPHTDGLPLPSPRSWRIGDTVVADPASSLAADVTTRIDQGAEALVLPPSVLDQPEAALRAVVQTACERGVTLHLSTGSHPALASALLEHIDGPLSPGSTVDDDIWSTAFRLGRVPGGDAWTVLLEAVQALRDRHEGLRLFALDARPVQEAGGSTVHQLGVVLAAARAALTAATERGLAAADAAALLHAIVPIGSSYFLEIAKLRALRLVMPQLVAAYDEAAADMRLWIRAETARWTQTLASPYTNVLRGTTQAAAAVVGGCDVLRVLPYDAALGAPSAESLRLARTTQLLLRHEAYFDRVLDPSAGAYYVEALTDQVAEAGWTLFQEIERRGGLAETVASGWLQREIAEHREAQVDALDGRTRVLVGLNDYPDAEPLLHKAEPGAHDPAAPAAVAALTYDAVVDALSGADVAGVGRALDEALQATLPSTDPLPRGRLAEPIEALRRRTQRYAERKGRRPRFFLLLTGDPRMRSARATFARNFLGVAGFDVLDDAVHEDPAEGVEAARAAGADAIVLCSADETYREAAPTVCSAAQRTEAPLLVLVAGHPDEQLDALRAAGVDAFLHRGARLLSTLSALQGRFGIEDAPSD